MTTEWRPEPGKPAMVMVYTVLHTHAALSDGGLGVGNWVSIDALHPLPTPDPLAEKRDAVVRDADAWRDNGCSYSHYLALRSSVDALRAATAPVDPRREAIARVLRQFPFSVYGNNPNDLLDDLVDKVIAAIEERGR